MRIRGPLRAPRYGPTVAALTVVIVSGCGVEREDPLNVREVRLPNGVRISAEVMIRPEDQARGMKYRDTLEPERGMLFLHAEPGPHSYWMHNVKIPLDILWMDAGGRIVEISANTPPCLKEPAECPSYGGSKLSRAVLELAAGSVQRHGLKVGDQLVY